MLGDPVRGLILIAMVLLSVLLNFFMEFQARHAVEEIRKQVATTGSVEELPLRHLADQHPHAPVACIESVCVIAEREIAARHAEDTDTRLEAMS